MSNVFKKYQALQKKKAIGMLKALIDKLEKEEFILDGYGWWPTNVENRMIFRITVISRSPEKDSITFGRFS